MSASKTPTHIIVKAIAITIVVGAFVIGPSYLVSKFKDVYLELLSGTNEKVNKGWDTAKRIGKDIDDVIHFRPKITIGQKSVVEASKELAEISLVEKSFEHAYIWEHTWLGSTKRIKLKGHFIAKAGYDLTKPFSIDISEDGMTIRTTMPPAKINSLEQIDIDVLQDENGIWNKITAQERQNAMNAFLADAKKALYQTSLLADADAALMTSLEKIFRKDAPTASNTFFH